MANVEHLEQLKQGVEAWNRWRVMNPEIVPDLSETDLSTLDLSRADLRGSNLSGTDFSYADLSKANLNSTNLTKANLSGADLSDADISNAEVYQVDFSRANLSRVDLSDIDLSEVDLSEADLNEVDLRNVFNPCELEHYPSSSYTGADLSGIDFSDPEIDFEWVDLNLSDTNLSDADFYKKDLTSVELYGSNLSGAELSHTNLSGNSLNKANLSYARLVQTQALGTDFSNAVFTGACIEDWNINSATRFEGAICDYVYLKTGQQERRPRVGAFKPGEFAALFQQAVDTVDLIFVDGLDWQSFFATLQEIRQQYDGADINIQAIEKKSGGAFVVRLEVSESLDKADFQQRLNVAYEKNQQLQAQLLKTEGKLEECREQRDNFQQKVLEGMNTPKYVFNQPQFGGSFAETVHGNQYGGIINNYGPNTEDITRLLTALRDQAQTFPTDQKDDANDVLDDLERDLAAEQPDQGRIGRRLKRLVAISTTLTIGATAFTADLAQLADVLNVPLPQIEQVQPE